MSNKIAVCVVCYSNEREVVEFAKKLTRAGDDFELYITCNKVLAESYLISELDKLEVKYVLLKPSRNLGYLYGCLYPFLNTDINCDWILITNTDVSFGDDFFEVFNNANYSSEVWCIAPNIKKAKKHGLIEQNPFALVKPSKGRMMLWNFAYSNLFFFNLYCLLARIKRVIVNEEVPVIENGPIFAAHGSCFFLRPECVKKIIEKKAPIFMYGEELFVGALIEQNNMQVEYCKQLNMLHFPNQITSLVGNRKKQQWYKKSFRYLLKEYW